MESKQNPRNRALPLITVLIVWQYGANLGHIGRLLPIARSLRASGANVVFAVGDAEAAQTYLGAEAFDWCLAPRVTLSGPHLRPPVNQAEC